MQSAGFNAFPTQKYSSVPMNPPALSALPGILDNSYATSSSQPAGEASFPNSGSSPASPISRGSSSERSTSAPKLSIKNTAHPNESSARVEKRRQNTLAARRYRQKRVDQMSTLESTLQETRLERDDLKVRVARLEGEVETLRRLLSSKS
ncbi:hypothetical protein K491DRAFT_686582 [Lophiostoma macrostomum CBS 122681]|uniref:BZIP domain-containing protein n=1 Tax=Lophiostoma macrostomum CBS 122681 TaxID=1314788 RepID=A0A6A6TTE3_9PLEO|nr:hypothetical protein K491DRAFT_686582 [Lophiostoma macrostomum CBS 122681]